MHWEQETRGRIYQTENRLKKLFSIVQKVQTLDENEQDQEPEEDMELEDGPYTATPLNIAVGLSEQSGAQSVGDCDDSFIQEYQQSNLDVSLNFHDYGSGPIPTTTPIRMIETQTCLHMVSREMQTEESESAPTFVSVGTQTECEVKDVDEQTALPSLVFEDVMNNSSKVNFYTGIPNKDMFNALFDEMGDIHEGGGQTNNHSSGGRPRSLR